MEIIIRLIKICIISAILYAAYYFLIREDSQDKPTVYNIDSGTPERVIESPKSIVGMTFTSDEGIEVYFEKDKQCKVYGTNEENGFKIKGTPNYNYKKKNKTEADLRINFTVSKEKGREIIETEYRYNYEIDFTKPSGGKAHCNYVFTHKMGAGDKVKSFVEADTRPTWFELK